MTKRRLALLAAILVALAVAALFLATNATDGVQVAAPRHPDAAEVYRSDPYGFTLSYPRDLTVAQYDEGSGASTITFQNVANAEGFQIFIVPYSGERITSERFALDEPSHVKEAVGEIYIDGAQAETFFGRDALLGDTWEIWFIRGGFLYEISTPKTQQQALAEIMRQWRFL